MKYSSKYSIAFIIVQLFFLLPIIISSVTIAAQVKASVTVSELMGFTSEPYDFIEMYNLDEGDIIDKFVNKSFPPGFHKEQERAILRDHGYPVPVYFYVSILIILLYIAVYFYFLRKIKLRVVYKVTPFLLFLIINLYFVIKYSDNYRLIIETFEYYL